MTAIMFLMRSFANDNSSRSHFLYFASILPLIAGSQNAVVVDSWLHGAWGQNVEWEKANAPRV